MSPRALETQTVEAPTLVTLAERIGALHREIKAQPGRYAEMNSLLTQAKKDAGERGWLKWLTDNRKVLGFGERQARNYLREPEVRTSDQAKEAKRQRERRAAQQKAARDVSLDKTTADLDALLRKMKGLPPLVTKPETTEVLPETKPPKTTQNKEAPANEQPAPKKLKPGSLKSRLSDLESIARDLRDQAAVSKLTRRQRELVAKAIEDIQHFERIAQDPVQVREVAFAVVKLWNESGGVQIETEGKYSKYTMQQVREAVACELNFDRWASAIKEMTRIGGEWVTESSFMDLIVVRNGKPLGLECDERDLRQWVADEATGDDPSTAPEPKPEPAVPEAVGDPGAGAP